MLISKGIKNKFFRFKQIFKAGLDKYLEHTKYDTPYIRDEVNKRVRPQLDVLIKFVYFFINYSNNGQKSADNVVIILNRP